MAEENVNVSQGTQNDTGATSNEQANTTQPNADTTTQATQNESQAPSNESDIEKLIQRAVDRATNKLGNENKKLRDQLETVKKEKLTEREITELELKDREADITDRELKLQEKENRLFAIKAIKDAGLDDGSSNALELVDFVISDNEETTKARVKTFSDLVNKMVAAKVSETFKSNGRNPDKGGNSGETTTGTNALAINIGKNAAERAAATNNVLKHYLGGK